MVTHSTQPLKPLIDQTDRNARLRIGKYVKANHASLKKEFRQLSSADKLKIVTAMQAQRDAKNLKSRRTVKGVVKDFTQSTTKITKEVS